METFGSPGALFIFAPHQSPSTVEWSWSFQEQIPWNNWHHHLSGPICQCINGKIHFTVNSYYVSFWPRIVTKQPLAGGGRGSVWETAVNGAGKSWPDWTSEGYLLPVHLWKHTTEECSKMLLPWQSLLPSALKGKHLGNPWISSEIAAAQHINIQNRPHR